MTTCATCGSHLSRDYLRVCGDNDDTVRDCPHCAAARRAESRRSPADGSDSGTDGEETDPSKMVLTIETNSNREGSSRRSGRRTHGPRGDPGRSRATGRPGDGRQPGGRARRAAVDGEANGRESDSRPSALSSVFDVLR